MLHAILSSMLFIVIILLALGLPAVASFLISRVVFNRLVKTDVGSPRVYQVITFLFSFIVIFGGIALLALYNIRIER
jgi:hypothetical protein